MPRKKAQKKDQLKFKQLVEAVPSEVYGAFTNGAALCEWFCDVAQVDVRLGGHLYLGWEGGYFVNGELPGAGSKRKSSFFLAGRR